MKFTTKQEGVGESRIYAGGKPTQFLIVKGDDPKWGLHREWHICADDGAIATMTVYRRKSDALHAFGVIWRAAIMSQEATK